MANACFRIFINSFTPKATKSFSEKDKVQEAKSRIFDLTDEIDKSCSLFEVVNIVE